MATIAGSYWLDTTIAAGRETPDVRHVGEARPVGPPHHRNGCATRPDLAAGRHRATGADRPSPAARPRTPALPTVPGADDGWRSRLSGPRPALLRSSTRVRSPSGAPPCPP